MIPGDWRQVLIVTLLVLVAVGLVIVRPKKRGASRLRKLRRIPVDPWSGAIVRQPKYFTPHWNAAVGRAYRAMVADRSN